MSIASFELLGVIKANVGYELLPAQIESIFDESGTVIEETKFDCLVKSLCRSN